MWTLILALVLENMLSSKCTGIHLIDLPQSNYDGTNVSIESSATTNQSEEQTKWRITPVSSITNDARRHWSLTEPRRAGTLTTTTVYEDEKDANLKAKISTLVQQTVHDTEHRVKSVQHLRDENKNAAPYRIGFILSMIKKSRDILNELFNLAVKHKDEWKALEQLKVFELIVHTNVDTTNLVRQLVELHIQHLNSTYPYTTKKRVVLL